VSIAKSAYKGVTYYDEKKSAGGYTLFSTYNYDVWLIDMEGNIVNRWRMPYSPGSHQWLLPTGNMLHAGMIKSHEEMGLPVEMTAIGGVLVEVDWDSNLTWKAMAPYSNHDIRPMDNGHVMYHSYNPDGILPEDVAKKMKGGLPGTEFEGQVWGDMVHELDRDGNVVWEWKACEHLDPVKDMSCMLEKRTLWPYVNALWICKDGNVLMSLRAANEAIKVDYKTGRIMARYGKGKIFHQHDARELDNGNIMILDNGNHRPIYGPNYSRVIELDPKTDEIVWEYKADFPSDFYTPVCAGAERMPNGNTVICDSWTGRIFEVTYEGELVWEYISPFIGYQVGMTTTMMWRAHRYLPDYPGLKGNDLDPKRFPLENSMFGPGSVTKEFVPSVF
jgi:hypothetical protein